MEGKGCLVISSRQLRGHPRTRRELTTGRCYCIPSQLKGFSRDVMDDGPRQRERETRTSLRLLPSRETPKTETDYSISVSEVVLKEESVYGRSSETDVLNNIKNFTAELLCE